MGTVHFSICGEFITDRFRDFVSEGNWRYAQEALMESLPGITVDQVQAILSGKNKLIGKNEVEFVDDTVSEDEEWVKSQYYSYYGNLVLINDKFYEVYGTVEGLCKDDLDTALERIGMSNSAYGSMIAMRSDGTVSRDQYIYGLNKARAETYLSNPSQDIIIDKDHSWLMLRPVTVDYPTWIGVKEFKSMVLNRCKNIVAAYHKMTCDLLDVDLNTVIAEAEDVAETQNSVIDQISEMNHALDNVDSIRDAVAKKADTLGGWMTLHDKETGDEYKIPRNPFLKWCLSDNPMYYAIEWGAVSARGMKMCGDDPNHTDWWLFTGIPLEEAHNHHSDANKFFFAERGRIFEEYTNSNIKPLIRGDHPGFREGFVIHIEDPAKPYQIDENSVVIIPNASPDFEAVAYKCADKGAILVTETGGKLCHLAIVGREFGLTLYLMDAAREKLPRSSIVEFDTKNDMVTLPNVSGERFKELMKSKISGLHYKY